MKQFSSVILLFTVAVLMALAAYYLVRTPKLDARHEQETQSVERRLEAVETILRLAPGK